VFYLENAPAYQQELLTLYSKSGPETDRWYSASTDIPSGLKQPLQIWVYGNQGNGTETDVVAIDNLCID